MYLKTVLLTILLLLYTAIAALATPLLYHGELVVKKVSGKDCTGKEAGRAKPASLILEEKDGQITGYLWGDFSTGRFSGKAGGILELRYAYLDPLLRDGHSILPIMQGDTLIAQIRERHLAADQQGCNWDDAELKLARNSEDAFAALKKAEARFNAHAIREEGAALYKQKKYIEAIPLYEKALNLREEADGKTAEAVSWYLRGLVHVYVNAGRLDDAQNLLTEGLKRFHSGEANKELTETRIWLLGKQAVKFAEVNVCIKAVALYRTAIDIAESREFDKIEQKEDTLLQLYEGLAECLAKDRNFKEADEAYKRVFSLKEKVWIRPRHFLSCPEIEEQDPMKAVSSYASGHLRQDEYSRKTAQCYFSQYSGRIPYKISSATIKEYPELAIAILITESMDQKEKQYWFDLLPLMNEDQTDRLLRILTVESKRLFDLEIKYMHEITALNKKHLFEWELFKLIEEGKMQEAVKLIESANIPDYPELLVMQAALYRSRMQLAKAAEQLEYALRLIERKSGVRTVYGLVAIYNLAVIRLEQGELVEFGRILKENDLVDYPMFDPASIRVHDLGNDNVWLSSSENLNRFFTAQLLKFSRTDLKSADILKKTKQMLLIFSDGTPLDSLKKNRLHSMREDLLKLSGQADRLPQSRLVVNKGCGDGATVIWSGKNEYVTLNGNNVSLCSREGNRLIITVASPLPVASASYADNAIHLFSDDREFVFDQFFGRILKINKTEESKDKGDKSKKSSKKIESSKPGFRKSLLGEDYHVVASDHSIALHNISSLNTSEMDLKNDCRENIREIATTENTLAVLCGKKLITIDMKAKPAKVAQVFDVPLKSAFLSTSRNQIALNSPPEKTANTFKILTLKPGLTPNMADFSGEKNQRIIYADTERVITTRDDGQNKGIIAVYSSGSQGRPLIFDQHFSTVQGIDVSEGIAATFSNDQLLVWSLATGKTFWSRPADRTGMVKILGNTVVLASGTGEIKKYYLYTGEELSTLQGHEVAVNSISVNNEKVATLDTDGVIKLWSPSLFSGAAGSERFVREKITLLFVNFQDWIVIDPEGRFDSSNIDDIKVLHWILLNDPLKPLPFEIFMKDYYEPRLLQRLLAGEKLKAVRLMQNLKMVQPDIRIVDVKREEDSGSVKVDVQLARGEHSLRQNGIMVSSVTGVHDLKLFRDGQLVGFQEGKLALDKDGKAVVTFRNIRLPRKTGNKDVEFSAYAFNDDGIKSLTSRTTYAMPKDITPAKGKAYLVNIGVNQYQNNAWNLQYAAGDATSIRASLEKGISKSGGYSEIIPITLTDTLATKQNIKAIFDLLSGKTVSPELKKRIPNADRLTKATPEDMLIISFSGHGHVDNNGIFYTFTHDTGAGTGKTVTPTLLSHIISSDELSNWLRYVDAGQMAMIVDACHSAATVGDSFKPGPMGSRGLGQLAYDKGMRILAASQADDVALESDKLQHGLLTYSLVKDGIEAFQADYKPKDKSIQLSEWLAYGVDRVPKLYEEVKTGNLSIFGRGEAGRATVIRLGNRKNDSLTKKNPYQTPSLFDFTRKTKGDVSVVTR